MLLGKVDLLFGGLTRCRWAAPPIAPLTGEGASGRAGKPAVCVPQPAHPAAAGGPRGDLAMCERLTDACLG